MSKDHPEKINRQLNDRIPELGSRSDRVRWNKGLFPPEIEWNDYRRDRLNRIWRAIHSLPTDHPLWRHEVWVPMESGPGSLLRDFSEMENDINYFSDPEVSYCLGYLTARFDFFEESGLLDKLFEDTGTDCWLSLLDATTNYQYKIIEEPAPMDEADSG